MKECPTCGGTMYDDLDGRWICQDCPTSRPAPLPAEIAPRCRWRNCTADAETRGFCDPHFDTL